ncbi:hypothetical protein EDD18DRAFT_1423754 [Armillaria luteobubalina]|uniref:Apple domain-containing protein n=1 Tax=Armillaria luteobubalina TaxID=153913 RepID=A0AA39UHX0_9AGAR|nr:hypothetical protein EDD18DRAFT_1423754 [Armillaria luteobubalina]
MRFSLAALVPLAVLVVPGLSNTITARQPGGTMTVLMLPGSLPGLSQERISTVRPTSQNTVPAWMIPSAGSSVLPSGPTTIANGSLCLSTGMTGKAGSPASVTPSPVDCKDLCLAHDNCNSCQVYTLEEAAEQFICALFEEIVDITTWEDDCEDDWVDDWVYYSSSYWNVYY